ncbi:hypothetical protein NDU88_005177 [Pleurodeles waltl]|uniref:Uncharacterized protein n=1 Tax=Pleurodeles waltl TaxID=8319 RepID=A0AAV7LM18_PLEWA|nr:hypothetical protein NDU88_005177 [Pleurodeles waltl]
MLTDKEDNEGLMEVSDKRQEPRKHQHNASRSRKKGEKNIRELEAATGIPAPSKRNKATNTEQISVIVQECLKSFVPLLFANKGGVDVIGGNGAAAEEALRLARLIQRHLGGPKTGGAWLVTEPVSAEPQAKLLRRADSLEWRTEDLGWVHAGLRPVVLGRVVVRARHEARGVQRRDRPQERTRGEIPQSIGAPLGAKTRLGVRCARGLPGRQKSWTGSVRICGLGHSAGPRCRRAVAGPSRRSWQGEGSPKHWCPIGGTEKHCDCGGRVVGCAGLPWLALSR